MSQSDMQIISSRSNQEFKSLQAVIKWSGACSVLIELTGLAPDDSYMAVGASA